MQVTQYEYPGGGREILLRLRSVPLPGELEALNLPRSDDSHVVADNHERVLRRRRTNLRRTVQASDADRLLTLTFPTSPAGPDAAMAVYRAFLRTDGGAPLVGFVAVAEVSPSGRAHLHAAVRGYVDVVTLRSRWTRYLRRHGYRLPAGVTRARVHVTAPVRCASSTGGGRLLAGYLGKYLGKSLDSSAVYWPRGVVSACRRIYGIPNASFDLILAWLTDQYGTPAYVHDSGYVGHDGPRSIAAFW